MTTNVAPLRPRSSHPEQPHLPPIARGPVDDAREIIAELRAAGDEANVKAAELVSVLQQLVAIITGPRRPELAPWKRLPVEQARMFIDQLADVPRDSELDCARQLGRLEVHAHRLLDVLDSLCEPW